MGELVIVAAAVQVVAVEGVEPAEVQVQRECGNGDDFKGPIGFQDEGRFFDAPFDQLPQKRREHQRHQIVRDEREVIAGSGYGSPEQARQTVEAPGDSVADQSGDADEYQDFRDPFLLQLVSEQLQDDAEN